jgi:hypothetical protein
MAIVEDSAHAIFTIIAASAAATGKLRRGYTEHFQKWYHARVMSEFQPNSTDPLIQSMRQRKSMNPFALEFFAQGILRRLGIRTVEQKICNGQEARSLPANYVVKVAGSGNSNSLKWNPNGQNARNIAWNPAAVRNGWCLVSKLEPDAATLDFVARKLITSQSVRTQMLRESAALHAQKDQTLEALIAQALGKTCVPADKFFADFKPTESEIELIKSAMALDGKKYLMICAARVFIGCSSPHFGNVLVTKKGELISIDHASGYFESEDHLKELFYFIDRRSDVFRVLDGINSLTEKDICEAVSEIPRHSACGSTSLADYFCKRLRTWKELYASSERQSAMEADPKLTYCKPSAALGARILADTGTMWPMWRA